MQDNHIDRIKRRAKKVQRFILLIFVFILIKNSRREAEAVFSAMYPDEGHGHRDCFYCGAIKNLLVLAAACDKIEKTVGEGNEERE